MPRSRDSYPSGTDSDDGNSVAGRQVQPPVAPAPEVSVSGEAGPNDSSSSLAAAAASATAPHPSSSSSSSSYAPAQSASAGLGSANDHDGDDEASGGSGRGRSHLARPALLQRKSSGTIIVPRHAAVEERHAVFPPDDARAMSPRRNSEETEAMSEETRSSVRRHAREIQLELVEIAESIELVKADYDKLEKQNLALQDYIGGLTRSMSRNAGIGVGSAKSSSKGR